MNPRTFANELQAMNMKPTTQSDGQSRRDFLKTATTLAAGAMLNGCSFSHALSRRQAIALVSAPDDAIAASTPGRWALEESRSAIVAQGASARIVASLSEAKPEEFCLLATGTKSRLAASLFQQEKLTAPAEPESLALAQGRLEGRSVLLAAGADERGLVYALTELADRVACLETSRSALEFAEPVIERPASRVRSVIRGFNSEVEDKPWFYDRDYWREYLTMLVYSRLNRMSFTTGMGYNSASGVTDGYLLFPYPFFVTVPGRDVRAQGLATAERERNLEMLKFIGEECARRGLEFQFAIWTLAHQWNRSAKATYKIEGLTDATHPAYCRDALALLLREVPQITGVTFRVHDESGIPSGAENFWQTQFAAIKDCGRRVGIDMHFKKMTPETLQAALATGQPVSVAPKYCGEHLGLPYHPSSIREQELSPAGSLTDTGAGLLVGNRKFTRYGYGDSLAENRTWDVLFRIWPGTQRFLLNADPATFAGYGRNAAFCGAAGIELSEPLHFKGRRGSGLPGGRLAYADKSLEPRYDFEKYRYTYRLWGRLGYNPDTNPEVWRRALRQEFGSAAMAVEQALGPASRVLTLFTLAHGISANCIAYWPEIYTNLPMGKVSKSSNWDMSGPQLFGNVGGLDAQLFMSPNDCADALLAGRVMDKYTPLEVAQWLEAIAAAAGQNIAVAREQLGAKASAPAFRRVEEDVLIQRALALFFAGKFRSAVLWRILTATGHRAAGEAALARYTEARDIWVAMAERARSVYRSNISYGGDRTSGHWSDRVPAFDADIADMREHLAAAGQPTAHFEPAAIERALKMAVATLTRATVTAQHTPAEQFHAGKPVAISLVIGGPSPVRVTLRYRHVNQAERWQAVEMQRDGGPFTGQIPAAYTNHRFALQYYFEIQTSASEMTLFPPLAPDLANVPYYVVRRAG